MEYSKCQLLQNHADVFQQTIKQTYSYVAIWYVCMCLKWYWLNGTGPAEAKIYRSGTGLVLVGKGSRGNTFATWYWASMGTNVWAWYQLARACKGNILAKRYLACPGKMVPGQYYLVWAMLVLPLPSHYQAGMCIFTGNVWSQGYVCPTPKDVDCSNDINTLLSPSLIVGLSTWHINLTCNDSSKEYFDSSTHKQMVVPLWYS